MWHQDFNFRWANVIWLSFVVTHVGTVWLPLTVSSHRQEGLRSCCRSLWYFHGEITYYLSQQTRERISQIVSLNIYFSCRKTRKRYINFAVHLENWRLNFIEVKRSCLDDLTGLLFKRSTAGWVSFIILSQQKHLYAFKAIKSFPPVFPTSLLLVWIWKASAGLVLCLDIKTNA